MDSLGPFCGQGIENFFNLNQELIKFNQISNHHSVLKTG